MGRSEMQENTEKRHFPEEIVEREMKKNEGKEGIVI